MAEAKKMQRSARLTGKQDAKLENKAREEPKAKKNRSANRTSTIATLDNGTIVEALKFLNYCQLAKNGLVSKRFLDAIRTHRHKLAFLCVDSIRMEKSWDQLDLEPAVITIFNQELSPEEYDEWVVGNNYSKHISLKSQAAVGLCPDYELMAYADYKGPNQERTSVFVARVKELNDETWPLFEHFVRLLTDPFVFICDVKLTPQTDVFKLLATTISRRNRGRLQCEKLEFKYEGNARKSFNWIKNHVRCVKFRIAVNSSSAYRDKQLLDFFATGSACTTETDVIHSHLSEIVLIDLIQKFVELKNSDENQQVKLIRGYVSKSTADALKSNYAKFFVNEEIDQDGRTTAHVFEFINNNMGKKLQLTVKNLSPTHQSKLEIMNL